MATFSIHQFDGDPADETAWRAFVAANSDSSPQAQATTMAPSTPLNALYELLLLFVVVVAFTGTVLWQKSTNQIVALEVEVQTLQDQLAAAESRQEATVTSSGTTRADMQRPMVHVVETDFVRIVTEPGTMAAVTAVAARIDNDYRQLREDLGLASMDKWEQYKVYITDNGDDLNAGPYAELGVIAIDVSAYSQSAAATSNDLAQRLYTDLFGQLAQRGLHETVSARKITLAWGAVISRLHFYVAQGQLPKPINALQPHELQRRHLAQAYSPDAVRLAYEPGWMYPNYELVGAIADPLVEYILVTYGRESIPKLLDALSEHGDWGGVPPTAFSIPADQFNAEWHVYLRQHYPIEPAESTEIDDVLTQGT